MALFYSEKYAGYIADVPNIHFIRCDGKVFYFDEVNSSSQTNTANSLTITGGQGNYPLAFIETDKNLDVTFASSQFTMEMFEMANNTNMTEGNTAVLDTAKYEVASGLTITIPYECNADSIQIRGLEKGDAAAAGKFKVEVTNATAEAAGSTVLTFAEGDVAEGDEIRVTYQRRAFGAQTVSVTTRTQSSRGEVWMHYPVYSAGVDCTESAIKAILHIHIWRTRVTQAPGFDTSYKTAATNSITFAAMDAKRADGKVFELIYEPMDKDGNVVAAGEGTANWN